MTSTWKNLMEKKAISEGFVCVDSSCVDSLSLMIRMFSLPGSGRTPSSWVISCPNFKYKEGGQRAFLHLLFLKCIQFKIITMPKQHILGWHVPKPFAALTIPLPGHLALCITDCLPFLSQLKCFLLYQGFPANLLN